ncbi:MAG TPA: class II fructose-bisphosphate aldolase [Candidatus Vogelbacteria bacterium]|nr:class II fructose-bisphosphate aldolase [Candidatus Vogelbacteria bacterium]
MAEFKLIDFLKQAKEKKMAIGHFNISNLEGFRAVGMAALSHKAPVIIGLSEGEMSHFEAEEVVALARIFQKRYNHPIFLNADHVHSIEKVIEATKAGFHSITADSSQSSLEDNIAYTKKASQEAKKINPEILIEGEIGYIGGSSKELDELPEDVSISEDSFTDPDEALRFVQESEIDLFAPAIGNIHGRLKNVPNPRLDIERIKKIAEKTKVPLVLHGGSGITDEDFTEAIKAGIRIIHINTEIRVIYRQELEKALNNNPSEIAPYKLQKEAMLAMAEQIVDRIELFSSGEKWEW